MAAAAVTHSGCIGRGDDLTTDVTSRRDCEISSAHNDNPAVNPVNGNPMKVNRDDGFFDINTWEYGAPPPSTARPTAASMT